MEISIFNLVECLNELEKYQTVWESLCHRCGACCGAFDDDPCSNLEVDQNGNYKCKVYQNRLGRQVTVKGNQFNCVPIRDVIHVRWPGDENCGYKKKIAEMLNDL